VLRQSLCIIVMSSQNVSTQNSNRSRGRNNRRGSRRNRSSPVNAFVRAMSISTPSPPQFNSSHKYFKRVRFLATGAVTRYPISSADIATLLVMATTDSSTATAYPLWSRYRLVQVEMWATASALTTPANLELSFADPASGTATNSEQTSSDIAKSVDEYAHVRLVPKPTASAALWQNVDTTGTGFYITCPSGSIIDLTLDVYLNNGDPVQSKQVYAAGTAPIVVGRVFMDFLDPSSDGSQAGVFQPIGYYNSTDPPPTPRV